jgi:glycosyltransferase involved in cell wall biosynthesis
MLSLAGEFAATGRRVHFAVGRSGGALEAFMPTGVDLHCLGHQTTGIRLAFDMVRGVAKLLDRQRPVAVLSTLTGANYAAALAFKFAKHRSRLVLREASSLANRPGPLHAVLRRWLYPQAVAVILPTAALIQEWHAAVPSVSDRIAVIPNPVDAAMIHKAAKTPAGVPATAGARIIAVGRLTVAKDYRTLIQAFKIVLRQKPGTQLAILGDGPLRNALSALVLDLDLASNVLIPGYVENVPAWLATADLFVLSSRWEGSPNALIEALVIGLPVVATRGKGGAAELLANGKHGRLAPAGAPEALARAMLESLDDPIRYNSEDVLGDRSPQRIAQQYLQFMIPESV